eukprot:237429_1
MREYSNPPSPIIFEIHSILSKSKIAQLHCGVLQFTADPKTVRIPYWMTYCLKNSKGNRVTEGDRMKFKLIRGLEPAKFAKFRPLDKRFARDIQTPRASLEHALRKFTVLTAGQRIPIIHDGKVYPLKVEEVTPSPAGHLIDTYLKVEFAQHDDAKTMDEEDDIQGLISGAHIENKHNIEEDKEDTYVEVEEISLYATISNTIKVDGAVYYKVKIGNPNFGVRFVLNITDGDANVYIHYDFDKPSIANHHWYNESESKKKIISVSNSDKHFSNWFYIGIHSYCADCVYEFTVDQDMTETVEDTVASNGNVLGSAQQNTETVPPNMELCGNCGKLIAKQSFMMHSMRCANVNFKCEVCDKVLAKSMRSKHMHCTYWKEYHCQDVLESESALERHVSLRHTEIACSLCGCKLFPNQIRSHQEHECTLRKVGCSFCGMKLKYLEMEQHEKYCGSLTIECELCGEMVTRKWLQNHLASEHNINPTLQTNLVNTIIHSNLGLNQNMDWEQKEEIKGLDDDDEDAQNNANDLSHLDPVVQDIQRQLSHTSSVGDVGSMKRSLTSASVASEHDKIEEDQEEEYDDDVYEFICPFCQKHP